MRELARKDGAKQGEQQKSSSKLNLFPPLSVGPGLLDGLNRKPLYDSPGLSLRPQPPAATLSPRAPVAFPALQSAPTLMRSAAGKLKVNDPGDAFEREAGRVADRVTRMGNPEVAQRPAAANEGLQRKCASCQEEEEESPNRHRTAGRNGRNIWRRIGRSADCARRVAFARPAA